MAVTKTKFINYIRCPRYVALENIKQEFLISEMTLKEYLDSEKEENINELISTMYNEEEDLIDVNDIKLETLLPYYKKIEILAGEHVKKYLKGNPKYSSDTLNQESFDFIKNGIRYLCYVDIYNERKDGFDIIEVKSITTNTILNLGPEIKGEVHSIFIKDNDGIYRLLEETNYKDELIPKEKYLKNRSHLFDKYHNFGHYVYDLAVQKYIVEQDLKSHDIKNKDIKYYLAVLNSKYIYNGFKKNDECIYEMDENGNEIISLIDLTNIMNEYMDKLKIDFEKVEEYIKENNNNEVELSNYCSYKKTTACKFQPICFKKVPSENSVFCYMDVRKIMGYSKLDLINMNILHMLDVKENDLTSNNNIIQRSCVEKNKDYIDKNKIKLGLDNLEYPIYHLDFETFPCPLPRFEKEKCYQQSPFQFSLHIERKPGECDIELDNYSYLAKDNINDYRKEIGYLLCKYIDIDNEGTILAHNVSFERSRLKEIADLFDDDLIIKNKLLKMASKNHSFDTLYLLKNNKSFYEELGLSNNLDTINYYHPKLNGSYSIKKVLPIFSKLSYSILNIKNGTEALVTYANFDKMTKEEYEKSYNSLIKYCKQDTWAMVEILKGLRTLVK